MGHLFWADHHPLIPHNNQRKPNNLSFFQTPKTPLQKSMDRLGKQLTLFSFGIIGEWDAALTLPWLAVGSLRAPGLLFQKHLWVWVTWAVGVRAETALNERSGCLIAFFSSPTTAKMGQRFLKFFFDQIISHPHRFDNAHWLAARQASPQHVHHWSQVRTGLLFSLISNEMS